MCVCQAWIYDGMVSGCYEVWFHSERIKHTFLGCSFRVATSEHACSRVFNELVCVLGNDLQCRVIPVSAFECIKTNSLVRFTSKVSPFPKKLTSSSKLKITVARTQRFNCRRKLYAPVDT